jgi:hypothetical protein
MMEPILHAYQNLCTFFGDKNNPLLAPRGVFLYQNLLVVSDTGNNRVCLWKNFCQSSHQPPDIILGQLHAADSGRNQSGEVTAASLQYPSGIWTNGEVLIVADAWNHRVLIWHGLPKGNGQPADVIIGQPDERHNQPNVDGIAASPDAGTLYWPYGVWSSGKDLYIADTGNRRVLYFENIPKVNGACADKAIGQPDMQSRDYDPQHAIWPYAVKTGPNGELAIADTQYCRVLLWANAIQAFQQQAPSVVMGQPNMQSSGQNQYRLKPTAHTLNWCYDMCFTKQGIAIADTANSRMLLWDNMPVGNNQQANALIGQPDFETHGESSLSMKTTLKNEMYWPFAVQYHDGQMIVADTGNHCIRFYKKSENHECL